MKGERVMSKWGLITLSGKGPIIAGEEAGGLLRTSTPLVEFDCETMRCTTASGRPYRLAGYEDRKAAMNALLSFYDITGARPLFLDPSEVIDVIRRNGNRPQELSAEERAEIKRVRLEMLGREISHWLGIAERWHGLMLEQIAEASPLPFETIEKMSRGLPADVTVDEAEALLELVSAAVNDQVRLPGTRSFRR